MVRFDHYTGPTLPDLIVPITPVRRSWLNGSFHCTRLQIPLRLSWAMTIHKAQGLTLSKTVVDIGKKSFLQDLLMLLVFACAIWKIFFLQNLFLMSTYLIYLKVNVSKSVWKKTTDYCPCIYQCIFIIYLITCLVLPLASLLQPLLKKTTAWHHLPVYLQKIETQLHHLLFYRKVYLHHPLFCLRMLEGCVHHILFYYKIVTYVHHPLFCLDMCTPSPQVDKRHVYTISSFASIW